MFVFRHRDCSARSPNPALHNRRERRRQRISGRREGARGLCHVGLRRSQQRLRRHVREGHHRPDKGA